MLFIISFATFHSTWRDKAHKVVRAGEGEYCLAPAGSHHFGVGRQLMLLLCLSSTVPSDGYGSYTLGSYTILLKKCPRMIVHYRKVDREQGNSGMRSGTLRFKRGVLALQVVPHILFG